MSLSAASHKGVSLPFRSVLSGTTENAAASSFDVVADVRLKRLKHLGSTLRLPESRSCKNVVTTRGPKETGSIFMDAPPHASMDDLCALDHWPTRSEAGATGPATCGPRSPNCADRKGRSTQLAVRLSQRVATTAQRSTSMVREGMLSLCAEEKSSSEHDCRKNRGKCAGPKPVVASVLLKGAQSLTSDLGAGPRRGGPHEGHQGRSEMQ